MTERDDPLDQPVDPGDSPTPTPALEDPEAGTGVRTGAESDPYGLELRAGDVVQSDLVGIAELSSEYTMDHAIQHTDATPDEVTEAWHEAAADSLESPLESPRDR